MPANLAPLDRRALRPEAVEWTVSPHPVGYVDAVRIMESRAALIARGEASGRVWLL